MLVIPATTQRLALNLRYGFSPLRCVRLNLSTGGVKAVIGIWASVFMFSRSHCDNSGFPSTLSSQSCSKYDAPKLWQGTTY